MDLVSRSQWGATAPLGPNMKLPAVEQWLHHSVTNPTSDPYADMRTLERIGVQRFGRFSYSFAVHPSGVVMIGAGYTIGAHTGGRNSTSFGIVWIGNYQTDRPTPEMIEVTAELIRYLLDQGKLVPGIYPTGGHRDVKDTACPGDFAYVTIPTIRRLVTNPPQPTPEPTPEPPAPTEPEEPDVNSTDVVIIRTGSSNFVLRDRKLAYLPDTASVNGHTAADIPVINVSERTWANYRALYGEPVNTVPDAAGNYPVFDTPLVPVQT